MEPETQNPDASSGSVSDLLWFLWPTAILVAFLLTAANVILGDLNQDEGWYLYAARLVAQGQRPYVDFAYSQGPVLPYVYAGLTPAVARWGLLAGRLFTALLGFAAVAGTAWLAGRLAPRGGRAVGAFLALVLVGVNVYQSYFNAVVKTYALASLLLVAAFLLLTVVRGRARRFAALAAGAALAFATGTRLSAAVAAPVALIWLWLVRRERPGDWFWLAAGGAAAGGIVVLPFLIAAPESFLFWMLQYHPARDAGGLLPLLVYKAGFISRVVQAYFVFCSLTVGLALAWLLRRRAPAAAQEPEAGGGPRGAVLALWAAGLGISGLHFMAPFPYDDYQVMVFPVLAAALAATAVRAVADRRARTWLAATLLLVSIGAAFSSPINQDWFIRGRDRIWWRVKEQTPLRKLQATAARVRALAKPGDLILTQDPYLAVEAGLTLPRGLELGQFSYFPQWDDRRAQACHVLNRPLLERLVRTCGAPVAAFSGYGLAIQSPAVKELAPAEREALWAIVRRDYEPVETVEAFGQAFTRLTILKRRGSDDGAAPP